MKPPWQRQLSSHRLSYTSGKAAADKGAELLQMQWQLTRGMARTNAGRKTEAEKERAEAEEG